MGGAAAACRVNECGTVTVMAAITTAAADRPAIGEQRRARAITRPARASTPAAPPTKTTTRKMVKAVGKPHIPQRYPKPARTSAPAATTAVKSAGSTRYEGRRGEVMPQSIVKLQ